MVTKGAWNGDVAQKAHLNDSCAHNPSEEGDLGSYDQAHLLLGVVYLDLSLEKAIVRNHIQQGALKALTRFLKGLVSPWPRPYNEGNIEKGYKYN